MTFLPDTNVLSELRRPDKAHANVRAWASSAPITNIFLSVVALLEIELGAWSVERRDQAQVKIWRSRIDQQVVPSFESRTRPIDAAVARRGARLHVPAPRAERDALIAATALVHRLTVVTRNRADFDPTGVRTLNPWGWPGDTVPPILLYVAATTTSTRFGPPDAIPASIAAATSPARVTRRALTSILAASARYTARWATIAEATRTASREASAA